MSRPAAVAVDLGVVHRMVGGMTEREALVDMVGTLADRVTDRLVEADQVDPRDVRALREARRRLAALPH